MNRRVQIHDQDGPATVPRELRPSDQTAYVLKPTSRFAKSTVTSAQTWIRFTHECSAAGARKRDVQPELSDRRSDFGVRTLSAKNAIFLPSSVVIWAWKRSWTFVSTHRIPRPCPAFEFRRSDGTLNLSVEARALPGWRCCSRQHPVKSHAVISPSAGIQRPEMSLFPRCSEESFSLRLSVVIEICWAPRLALIAPGAGSASRRSIVAGFRSDSAGSRGPTIRDNP